MCLDWKESRIRENGSKGGTNLGRGMSLSSRRKGDDKLWEDDVK